MKGGISMKQHCNIEYDGDPTPIHCPVCGTEIIGKGKTDTCEHLVFYKEEGWAYIAPWIDKGELNINLDASRKEDVDELLKHIGKDSIVCLSVTPIKDYGIRSSLAFDFNPPEHTVPDDLLA